MAGVETRNGSHRIRFLHDGREYGLKLGKVSLQEAEAKAAQVEYLLLRLDQGLIAIPPGVDVVEFVAADGRVDAAAPIVHEPAGVGEDEGAGPVYGGGGPRRDGGAQARPIFLKV